jgi:CheY-like chemotaxis protein
LTAERIAQAIDLFLRRAYGDGQGLPTAPLPPNASGPRIDLGPIFAAQDAAASLAYFQRGDPGDDPSSRRYTLRLGNRFYPFMKFVLQEHLVQGEFFFSVDTHDNLDVPSDDPERARWDGLKLFNRALAGAIEGDWERAGLPTHAGLQRLLAGVAEREVEASKRQRLLLVDDDRPVCLGLGQLLRARGYEVEELHDGSSALERLAHEPRPDLVLLDYEMPGLDGQEVLRSLRADARLANLPVLLATASRIDLSRLERISGLLHKPYPRQVLFEMIAHLLGQAGKAPSA